MKRVFLLLAFLAGCATQAPAPVSEAGPAPAPDPAVVPLPAPSPQSLPPPRSETMAVAGLMDSARADATAGRLVNAAASLERALRIEPRNPRLWHELAQVRFRQGEYAQAENLATRSNSWASGNGELRAANQRLIEEARAARGR